MRKKGLDPEKRRKRITARVGGTKVKGRKGVKFHQRRRFTVCTQNPLFSYQIQRNVHSYGSFF